MSAALLVAITLAAMPQAERDFAIIPRPLSIAAGAGAFTVNARTVIRTDAAARGVGRRLADYLAPATGWRLAVAGLAQGSNAVTLVVERGLAARLGEEGYLLEVTPSRVSVRAAAPAGLFYGVQSLRQLLPAAVFRSAPIPGVEWTIPAVRIEDQPRFSWRGAHLDAGRHFMPREFVKKYIDLLALHKLNRFHWHLTEDQGWRLEIRRYPRLTAVGSCRSGTLVGRPQRDTTEQRYTTVPHCGYYTQDDVREIVAYAAERFVTVVPEIEMPGHSEAAIAAYPELGVTGRQLQALRYWGVSENILNPTDATVAFYQNILEEVLELFPSPWIHIGGDEAVKTQWQASPEVQARIRQLGLANEHEMQSWFIRQMDQWLTAHGRRMIGWDEILEGGLAPNATVMSWRGTSGGIAAARAGHDVVMTPTSHTYFDYYQSRDTSEALRIGGYLPLETVYAFEPLPDSLTPEQQPHILGTQGQLWSEYLPTPKDVEWQAFPRLIALAEVAWTPRERRDLDDFRSRLAAHLARLDALDVAYWRERRP